MRKSNAMLAFVVILTIAFLQGCFTLNQIGSTRDSGIEMTNSENASSIKNFTKTKKVNHFLWGLVSPADPQVEKLISDEVKANNGTRAVNVKLKYQQTFGNGFLTLITLGIYSPFTLTVSGDVVK
ncbi:hypothetical protein IIA28_06510 [candidate division KSB1 bacterium]|nr:hypothetical protein [candidate division KSB1 bacterium]